MGELKSQTEPDVLGSGSSRVYETSVGLLHAMFAPGSLLLARVAPDGWMPVFGRGRDISRSASALVSAFQKFGLSSGEGERLADEMLSDWQAIEVPEPRSRRHELTDVLRLAGMALRLLAHTPRFVWEVVRDRERDLDTREGQQWLARPGSAGFGVIRLVKTSVGWAEFEFWGGPEARLGVYREDGWLPLSRQRFHLDRSDLIDALRAFGLPKDEAEQVGSLVLAERQARLADDG